MSFMRYFADRWISILAMGLTLMAGSGLLLFIDVPFAVVCIVEGVCAAGFFLVFILNYVSVKGFYDSLLEAAQDPEGLFCLSGFLAEPDFQEGQIIYQILRQSEKNMNDRIAGQQKELKEYQEYVAIWTHEIKTPIAVSRLIMENHRNDITRSLSEEMDRLEGFVEQMLYYSKSSSLQDDYRIRPVLLRSLVTEAVRKQAKAMVAGKVTPRFENLDYIVLTDSKWMDFVLGQLISNGVKYRSRERKAELVFSAALIGREVVLSVQDNGIGIPPEDVGRIFRRGFTGSNGRNDSKSTGMGLYLCDTLCRKLGIGLSAVSAEGEGTAMMLKLPSAVREEAAGQEMFQKCNAPVRK